MKLSGARGMRWFRAVLWVVVLPLQALDVKGEGGETFRGRLANEVIGSGGAGPGEPVRVRVRVSGGAPEASLTIYGQLGSNLSFAADLLRKTCIVTALPVGDLPEADPNAPAENRVACRVTTDEQGSASLILDARVNPRLVVPASDATMRSVVALQDGSTRRIGATASAQIGSTLARPSGQ